MGVILAPVNGKGTALRLVKAGARELYMGFYDPAWTDAFGGSAFLNRMSGFGQEANQLSFEELLQEITQLKESLRDEALPFPDLFCVFNGASYGSAPLAYIAEQYLEKLAEVGFTGIIVSDEALVPAIHANGMKAVASTMCSIYNEDSAAYYRDAGIDRAILPRDLTLKDIRSVIEAVPELTYEVFLMRNGCVFADSHCMGLHKAGCPSLCRSLRSAPSTYRYPTYASAACQDPWVMAEDEYTYRKRLHQSACGLCALWQFEQMGVSAYKIVGRGDNPSDLCDDVALSWANLALAADSKAEDEYFRRMMKPKGIQWLCEQQGLSCYYPEVRF